jgi:hypothetical protein
MPLRAWGRSRANFGLNRPHHRLRSIYFFGGERFLPADETTDA